MTNEQTSFDFGMYTFAVQPDGGVLISCNDDSFYNSSVGVDEFKQLADAQQRVVWATQHWTSLVQVSDALESLLAVHPDVQLSAVYAQTDGKGNATHYRVHLVLPNGHLEQLESTAEVQTLFRQLNA